MPLQNPTMANLRINLFARSMMDQILDFFADCFGRRNSSRVTSSPRLIAASLRRIARSSATVGVSSGKWGNAKYRGSASTATSGGFRFPRRALRVIRSPTAAGISSTYCCCLPIVSTAWHHEKGCQGKEKSWRITQVSAYSIDHQVFEEYSALELHPSSARVLRCRAATSQHF